MLRIMSLVLIVSLGFDQSSVGGRYIDSAKHIARSVLHHFPVL